MGRRGLGVAQWDQVFSRVHNPLPPPSPTQSFLRKHTMSNRQAHWAVMCIHVRTDYFHDTSCTCSISSHLGTQENLLSRPTRPPFEKRTARPAQSECRNGGPKGRCDIYSTYGTDTNLVRIMPDLSSSFNKTTTIYHIL